MVLPTVANNLSQAGTLTGIHDIKAPIRLALLPYLSAYAENYNGANAHTLNGGLLYNRIKIVKLPKDKDVCDLRGQIDEFYYEMK